MCLESLPKTCLLAHYERKCALENFPAPQPQMRVLALNQQLDALREIRAELVSDPSGSARAICAVDDLIEEIRLVVARIGEAGAGTGEGNNATA